MKRTLLGAWPKKVGRGPGIGLLATACAAAMLSSGHLAFGQAASPVIPLVPGLTIVLAAHNAEPAGGTRGGTALARVAQGDYELVVTVTGVSAKGLDETTRIEAVDENRQPLQLSIHRHVLADDLARARLQILGFHTDDPQEIPGATSLGPSLAIMNDLRTTAHATYSVMNFLKQSTSTGTLTRVGSTPVPFPVLVNGRRTTLPAVRVTGLLKYGDKVRPWAQDIFDDAKHPLTLRFAYGAVGDSAAFTPEFTREVVRIDFPAPADRTIEDALSTACRVEMPGIYFDFDRATLNPESGRALTTIAEVLRRQPQWRLSIEGHTDNVGGDAYNQDLSTRRAAAVKTALVRDFSLVPGRLSSAGFGARRPVETNATIAGRAHNRRVELVRDCAGKP
jgi:outer membrane protein OmpA-like peptidoglycan-associated protein